MRISHFFAVLLAFFCVAVPVKAASLGASLLTKATWETPGPHYIPAGRTPVTYKMKVMGKEDVDVNGYAFASEIPTVCEVDRVHSNTRGWLEVTGDTDETFFMEGSTGEELQYFWEVRPAENHAWPEDSYTLRGLVSDSSGGGASAAVMTKFEIDNPHLSFTDVYGLGKDSLGIKDGTFAGITPKLEPPYGGEKEYYQDYAYWVDKGDRIHIEVPEGTTEYVYLDAISGISREMWNGISAAGTGYDRFYTQGYEGGEYCAYYVFPEDYEHEQQYYMAPNYWGNRKCQILLSPDGLSFASLTGAIVNTQGERFPLDDGLDPSGTGLYGPGFIGKEFTGSAPASGFLKLNLAVDSTLYGDSRYDFRLDDVHVTVDTESSVPEPCAGLLLVIGLIAVVQRKYRL